MATGITLNQLVVQHGKLDVDILWQLLYELAKYIHNASKDPASWKQGPVLLISSTKIILYGNGSVEIKCGSVGECEANLFQAPEIHSQVDLANKKAVEQVYVYNLGMTLYSSAEWGIQADEEVELPDELDEVLIGMVQECAEQRIHLSLVMKICENNLPSKATSLRNLVKNYLRPAKKEDEMEAKDVISRTASLPSNLPPPPPPPPLHRTLPHLPKLPSIDTIPDSGVSTRSEHSVKEEDEDPYSNADELRGEESPYNTLPKDSEEDSPYSNAEELGHDVQSSKEDPYSTAEDPYSTVEEALDHFPAPPQSEDPYSTVDEALDHFPSSTSATHSDTHSNTDVNSSCGRIGSDTRSCSSGKCTHTPVEVDAMYAKVSKPRVLSTETSMESTVSDFENPYGTLRDMKSDQNEKRIDTHDKTHDHSLCKDGKCSHTEEDISAMYSTVSPATLKRKNEQQVMKENEEPNLPAPPRSLHSFHTLDSTSSNEMMEETVTLGANKYMVIVALLNKEKPKFIVERDWLVERVFRQIKTKLGVKDKHLFGLVYSHDGVEEFLPLENKLKQYAAEKWKPDNPKERKPLLLEFRVKYFPPSPSKFKNGPTRLQYFYQLTQKIVLKGEYNITDEEAMELAAIALQIDHGDYRFRNEGASYEPYKYLPPKVFARNPDKNVRDALTHLHGNLDGMSQSEAIQSYLQVAENLQDYGTHFIQVQRNNHKCWLGVSLTALLVYQRSKEGEGRGSSPVRFEWHHIMNLSYKSKSFLLDISVPKKKSPKRYTFDTPNIKVSRNIMNMCADTHKFYLHIRDYLAVLPPAQLEPRFSIKTYSRGAEQPVDAPAVPKDKVGKHSLTRQDSNPYGTLQVDDMPMIPRMTNPFGIDTPTSSRKLNNCSSPFSVYSEVLITGDKSDILNKVHLSSESIDHITKENHIYSVQMRLSDDESLDICTEASELPNNSLTTVTYTSVDGVEIEYEAEHTDSATSVIELDEPDSERTDNTADMFTDTKTDHKVHHTEDNYHTFAEDLDQILSDIERPNTDHSENLIIKGSTDGGQSVRGPSVLERQARHNPENEMVVTKEDSPTREVKRSTQSVLDSLFQREDDPLEAHIDMTADEGTIQRNKAILERNKAYINNAAETGSYRPKGIIKDPSKTKNKKKKKRLFRSDKLKKNKSKVEFDDNVTESEYETDYDWYEDEEVSLAVDEPQDESLTFNIRASPRNKFHTEQAPTPPAPPARSRSKCDQTPQSPPPPARTRSKSNADPAKVAPIPPYRSRSKSDTDQSPPPTISAGSAPIVFTNVRIIARKDVSPDPIIITDIIYPDYSAPKIAATPDPLISTPSAHLAKIFSDNDSWSRRSSFESAEKLSSNPFGSDDSMIIHDGGGMGFVDPEEGDGAMLTIQDEQWRKISYGSFGSFTTRGCSLLLEAECGKCHAKMRSVGVQTSVMTHDIGIGPPSSSLDRTRLGFTINDLTVDTSPIYAVPHSYMKEVPHTYQNWQDGPPTPNFATKPKPETVCPGEVEHPERRPERITHEEARALVYLPTSLQLEQEAADTVKSEEESSSDTENETNDPETVKNTQYNTFTFSTVSDIDARKKYGMGGTVAKTTNVFKFLKKKENTNRVSSVDKPSGSQSKFEIDGVVVKPPDGVVKPSRPRGSLVDQVIEKYNEEHPGKYNEEHPGEFTRDLEYATGEI